jgi:AcrR family transcriptional regulator
MGTATAANGTRDRLLEAATEIFGAEGYSNARVRDICSRAGANVAAVNYHFGDKRTLYGVVLDRAFGMLDGGNGSGLDLKRDVPAELRLQAFVRSLMAALLAGDDRNAASGARLVARELIDPTQAVERIVERGIRPLLDVVLGAIRERLGPGTDEQYARRCASSVIGQCLFYYFARRAIVQLSLEPHLGPEDVEPIAAHVTAFTLAALNGSSGSGGGVPATARARRMAGPAARGALGGQAARA